ncbi:porin family protein [Aquabacterium sp. OR-4]|uniref:porin family protein n=1 Tax=Aquabacterium sp. OR-4 TaxID=2978127 RepID=UPI0021B43DC9|nr:porin family protein [Aquabacterium sp. OR-4]MDT7837563.1 porin family protein [Aquabacterium sp. OR-4]
MHIQRIIAAATLGLAAMAGAQAADLYAFGSVGISDWKIDETPGLNLDRKGTGFKLGVGSLLMPNLAVEGGYVNLGKAKLSGDGGRGSVKGGGVFVDAVGVLPLSSDFSAFAKLGIFHGKAKGEAESYPSGESDGVRVSERDSGTDIKFGFGVGWSLSKSVQLRAEWERFRFKLSGDQGDVDLLSLGVSYSF